MRMKLAGADIDRIDAARTAGKEHLRKSAGRGADIETDAIRDGDAETGERAIKLDAAPRYPRKGRYGCDRRIDRDRLGRLAHRHGVRRYEAGRDRGLGLGAAFEQAAFDQQDIGALARREGGSRFHSPTISRKITIDLILRSALLRASRRMATGMR